MAELKAKKKKLAAKPRFDRSKLNTAFMNNAKSGKDEVQGWALDFENDSQNVMKQPAAGPKKTESEQVQEAIQESLKAVPE